MVRVQTGNALDVLYTSNEDNRKTLVGLQQHGSKEIIPLPDPEGLIFVLQKILHEIGGQL